MPSVSPVKSFFNVSSRCGFPLEFAAMTMMTITIVVTIKKVYSSLGRR